MFMSGLFLNTFAWQLWGNTVSTNVIQFCVFLQTSLSFVTIISFDRFKITVHTHLSGRPQYNLFAMANHVKVQCTHLCNIKLNNKWLHVSSLWSSVYFECLMCVAQQSHSLPHCSACVGYSWESSFAVACRMLQQQRFHQQLMKVHIVFWSVSGFISHNCSVLSLVWQRERCRHSCQSTEQEAGKSCDVVN